MFKIEEYLNGPYFDENITVKVEIKNGVEEEFLIRRLDGVDSLRVETMTDLADKYIYTLGNCLLDGDTKKPIGKEKAKKFLQQYRAVAINVGVEIFKETRKLDVIEELENKEMENIEKNSEATDTESSTVNGVSDTDKIQKQQ